jgi:hypothetical protein
MVHGVLHIEFCLSYSYHGPGELQRPKSQFKQDGAVDSGVTVQQFYDEKVVCKLPDELDLESAGLGKSKDSLDKIEMSLSLDSAIHMFGPFLRYYTCSRLHQLPGRLNEVYTRELWCGEPIEKLYYTAKYIYCADTVQSVPKDQCSAKPEILIT